MYNNDFEKIFSKIEPDDALKSRIMDRIDNAEGNNMKISSKKSIRRTLAIGVCAAAVGITTAFAAGNIISYFQSDKAVELTSMEALSMYNDEVGATVSNLGYTLTLDNLATDDNFMHVFYTLKRDETNMTEDDFYNFFFICRINGKVTNFGNHNEEQAYRTEDGGYKGVMKLNVADMDIPDTFTLEMYSEPNILKEESQFEGSYLYDDDTVLTEEDKSKLLYISTTAKKADVKTASIIKNVNKKFPLTYYDENEIARQGEGEISKVIISPFGNQLVVTDKCEGYGGMDIAGYALFDENGQSLDILNTNLSGGRAGMTVTNKIEFLKADANTKALKIVPVKNEANYSDDKSISLPIGTYPMVFKVTPYGSIVVTNIRFSDGKFEIDYYKDGFSLWDPYFRAMDDEGNIVEPGGKLGCLLTPIVHHDTNSYTARYEYCGEYDENGNLKPFDMSTISKENLEKSFTQLAIGYYDFELDYDNAIDISLE